mgnify:CR=1 FL=1
MPPTPGFLPEFQVGMVKIPAFDTMPTNIIRKEGTALGLVVVKHFLATNVTKMLDHNNVWIISMN